MRKFLSYSLDKAWALNSQPGILRGRYGLWHDLVSAFLNHPERKKDMSKLLSTLIAAIFAAASVTAFAQAPASPAAPAKKEEAAAPKKDGTKAAAEKPAKKTKKKKAKKADK